MRQQQEGRQVSEGAGGRATYSSHGSDAQGKDTGGCRPYWGLLLGGRDNPCLTVTREMQVAGPARPMRTGLCTEGCFRGSSWAREGPLFWTWASWSWAWSPPHFPSLGSIQHTGIAHNLPSTLAATLAPACSCPCSHPMTLSLHPPAADPSASPYTHYYLGQASTDTSSTLWEINYPPCRWKSHAIASWLRCSPHLANHGL